MMTTSTVDTRKVEAFVGKVLNDSSATFVTTLAAFGDRLAISGPATSAEVASRAGIDEHYAREWLGVAYLTHDPDRLPKWARDLADTDDLVQETLIQTFKKCRVKRRSIASSHARARSIR